MKYCKLCLQPDTRPNTKFSEEQVCPACSFHATLKDTNWKARRRELDNIVQFGKEHSSSHYDCIIGVSGGKDSTRQALFVRDQLGMNPLLVAMAYPPLQITQRGVDNISNLIALGFDVITINPAPMTWQKLMRKGFDEYCNWAKSTEYALYSSVPRLAIAYQIPLIWWGENPALQLGDLKTLGKDGADGNNVKYMNTLSGGDISWMLQKDISRNDILQYQYPSDLEMKRANLRIIYLGYFWEDWSLVNNAKFACVHGLDIRDNRIEEIGDPYGVTSLDENWVSLNQMIKYYKFGFGRVTDYVNEDVRNGRMTRDEGITLVQNFDGTCSDEYIETFCKFVDISMNDFHKHVEKFVNKDLFTKISTGKWERKFKVGVGL